MRIRLIILGMLLLSMSFYTQADGYQSLYQAAGWVDQRAHFQDALNLAQQRYKNTVPSALYEALVANSNQRFTASAIDGRALTALRSTLANPQAALAFYQSPLGQKVVTAEVQASSSAQLLRHANGVPKIAAGSTRQLLIRNLAQVLPVKAMGAEVSLALASVAADSLSQMMPGLFSNGQTQGVVETQRQRFMNQMDVDATLMYLYRDLSDPELDEYLMFVQSPQGQAYYQAALQAVRAGLASGTETTAVR